MASLITDGSHRQPSRRKLALIRVGVMASLVLLSPFALLLGARYRHATAFDALHARVREIGQTSASEAIGLLRSIFKQLVAQDAFAKMKAVEISPFGIFRTLDTLSVHRFLFDREVSLGNFEEALVVAGVLPGRLDTTILQQVDCLVALGRRAEAIALLERNLDLDGWRGKLRRRLLERGGRHLRALQ